MRRLKPLRGTLSSARWQTRLALWGAAALAGLLVVAFAKMADVALALFFTLSHDRPWAPFLLAPTCGMLAVWLTQRYAPGAQGSGIPQVIAATRRAANNRPVASLVSLRIAAGKMLFGCLALMGGYSAGREGPSVQVAASILHFCHRFLPYSRALRRQDLILAGGAAGVAAAFNTPLAGVVFAVEELGRRLETRTSGVLLSSIILSGLVSIGLMGNYAYFGHLRVAELGHSLLLPVLVSGLVCGLVGGLFSKMMLLPQQYAKTKVWQWRKKHPVWFAGCCGLAVAILGWLSSGIPYGSGYAITSRAIAGDVVLPWYAPISRFLATLASYFSGIPGGIFAPSLAIGAAVGADLSPLFASQALPIIALCMAGLLAAVTQAPITSAIIVMEMVDDHGLVISLMGVCLLAKAVSSRFGPELYQQLALGFSVEHSADALCDRPRQGASEDRQKI